MLELLNVKVSLGIYIETCWWMIAVGLIGILLSCGSPPIEDENHEQNVEQPDLKNMVFIPAGEFLMGSSEGEGAFDEHPQHRVYLDAYYIDKYEVTNAQFKEFVEATGYVTDAERGQAGGYVYNPLETVYYKLVWRYPMVSWQRPHTWRDDEQHPDAWKYYKMNNPVTQVSWNDVQVYAKWAGKRLPSEAEWEKAAIGTNSRKWPWGNTFNLDIDGVTVHANIASEIFLPVGSFPTGISSYGVYDMAGNVQEWVADWYGANYYNHSPQSNPKGPVEGIARVLRGGSWRHQKSYQVLSTSREYQLPDYRSNFVGFRCVWNP